MGSEVGRWASDMALVGGVDRVPDAESEGWRRWEDRIQEVQGECGEVVWDGIWVRSVVEEEKDGGPLGKLTCTWDDGIYLVVTGTTGEMIVCDKNGVWRTRAARKTLPERWTRENLEMVGGVPWQMDEQDGKGLKPEVTIMDNDYRERVRGEAEGCLEGCSSGSRSRMCVNP